MVAWWLGEGNANDLEGLNSGIMSSGVEFAAGKVGEAFYLNNTNAFVRVPASASLKAIEAGSGLTIEGWIALTNVQGFHPIAEFNDGAGNLGAQFWMGYTPASSGVLFANLMDSSGTPHPLVSANSAVLATVFQHVAVTYDRVSGMGVLYVNGTNVARANLGNFTPGTGYDLWFGHRQGDVPGDWTYGSYLGGLLDEITLYNRSLSANEIASIYQAGSSGKCPPNPPVIVSQPSSQAVAAGQGASLSVTATGPGLTYQWQFETTNISGATNATYYLAAATTNDSGIYDVVVFDSGGSITSSNAVLTVIPPPRPATGSATLTSGFVTGVTLTDGGSGYTNTPLVRFIGGGGGELWPWL